MKTLNVIVLLFFAFDFIETECPVSILPDFCSDQEDSRCTSRYYNLWISGFSFAKKYPSQPRDLKLDITYTEDNFQVLNLTWRPPNDTSITYLLGYEIGIPNFWQRYIYDLSKAHLTPNDSEIVFSFVCKVKEVLPFICFTSLPIPKKNNLYCLESTKQMTEKITTVKPLSFTFKSVPDYSISDDTSNHSNLWYLFIGLGIFVLTIIIFAVFLVRYNSRKKKSDVIEEALENINKKNTDYSDDDSIEDEDGEV